MLEATRSGEGLEVFCPPMPEVGDQFCPPMPEEGVQVGEVLHFYCLLESLPKMFAALNCLLPPTSRL